MQTIFFHVFLLCSFFLTDYREIIGIPFPIEPCPPRKSSTGTKNSLQFLVNIYQGIYLGEKNDVKKFSSKFAPSLKLRTKYCWWRCWYLKSILIWIGCLHFVKGNTRCNISMFIFIYLWNSNGKCLNFKNAFDYSNVALQRC